MAGQEHTANIWGDGYVVGTCTYLKLEYNVGPSFWMNTHGILHHNGVLQLINVIDGRFCSYLSPKLRSRA